MTLDKINKILIMLVIMAFTFVIGMYAGGYHTGKNLQKVANENIMLNKRIDWLVYQNKQLDDANQNLEDRLKNYQNKRG
ncbi:hypothetical protein HMPREF1983_00944 [Gemella bergeri ATCC 700627]|uniref:Uncharacterized protein n=1 Tax=Gemella bergeri ATCC 700627 TaxID=1321820 RepID=U2QMV7_9BACL|nr:hypothetical protein [Gemella bergeri]ERK57841.1 hypothetical protein HMPREF1983_00944 [Gemella bergeri ATCC 700627]